MASEIKLNNDSGVQIVHLENVKEVKIDYNTIDKVINFVCNLFTLGIYQIVLNTLFVQAIYNNNTDRMLHLIKLGVQISDSDLFKTAKAGHIPAMQVLINHGGNIHAIHTVTSTSGGFSLRNGGIVHNSYTHIDDRYSVLDLAVRSGKNEMAQFLSEKKAASVSGEPQGAPHLSDTTVIYRSGGWFP